MTRVTLVEGSGKVRVVAMSEHAVERSCDSWQEAVDYCENMGYDIANMEQVEMALLESALVPGDGPDEGGSDQSNSGGSGEG